MDAHATLEALRALDSARTPAEMTAQLVAIARAWPEACWPQAVVDHVVETFGEHRRWSGYLRGKEQIDARDAAWVALMPWRERAVVALLDALASFEAHHEAAMAEALRSGLGALADTCEVRASPELWLPERGKLSAEGWARGVFALTARGDAPDAPPSGRACFDGDVVLAVEGANVAYAFSEHVQRMRVTFWAPVTSGDLALETDIAWISGGDDVDPPFSGLEDWGRRVAEDARVAERYADSWE